MLISPTGLLRRRASLVRFVVEPELPIRLRAHAQHESWMKRKFLRPGESKNTFQLFLLERRKKGEQIRHKRARAHSN